MGHRLFIKTPGRLEQLCSSFVYPFIVLQSVVAQPFVSFSVWLATKNDFIEQIKDLNNKNEALQAELIELQSTKNFVEETKDLQSFAKRYDMENKVLVRVLYKQIGNEHFVLLNAGMQKNITKNMVVVYKNCLVGKITEVYPFYSKAVLITDIGCQIASYCQGTKTVGIYQGTRSLESGALTYVDHLAQLKEGDRVISSGDGLVFPRGFAIGQIESFKDTGVHYDIKVKPLIDVTRLVYCYIVQKGDLT